MPPPVFPANGSLLAAPPFPPSGPGEARFPALSGSMKALRLPIPHPQSLIGSLPRSTRSSCSSCPPWRSWKRGGRFQAQAVGCRPPVVPVSASGRKWDLSGLQTVLPVPLLRSTTPVEPMRPCHPGHLGAAPATHTAKASTTADIGANPQLQHTLSTLHEPRYRRPCKTRFRLAGCAFPGRASIPQNRYERFQFVLFFILLSCSPDANGLSSSRNPSPLAPAADGFRWWLDPSTVCGSLTPSLRGALATKQSSLFFVALDCFAEPVIGRAFARSVGSQ